MTGPEIPGGSRGSSDRPPSGTGRAVTPGSVAEALGAAVDALRASGVESPRLDAELLLADAAGLDRARLISHPETQLEGAAGRRFGEMIRRRLRREPVAYILGRRWFRRLELRCDRRALIPRPETELLVEVALELGDGLDTGAHGLSPHVLDIGTGSGAVALAIADERPAWRVTATDTSPEALALARENAAHCDLSDRVDFQTGTMPAPLGDDSRPDLVVANLPYVAEGEWSALAPEIRNYEPRAALLAGPDGLKVIGAVVAEITERWAGRLPPIALEIGSGQGDAVAAMLASAGWENREVKQDLAGFDRVVIGVPSAST